MRKISVIRNSKFLILPFILLRMLLTQPQVMPFRRQYLRQATPILFRIYLIQQLTQCPKRRSFCLFSSTDFHDIIQQPPGRIFSSTTTFLSRHGRSVNLRTFYSRNSGLSKWTSDARWSNAALKGCHHTDSFQIVLDYEQLSC